MPKKRTIRNQIETRKRISQRRALRSKPDNSNLRDWLNVSATLATVLIGIIGIWNTAQISGLQDYFQSEIARRNRDLITLTQQSNQLSIESAAKREQLSKFQTSSSEMAARTVAQQSQIQESIEKLTSLRFEMMSKKFDLEETKREIDRLSKDRTDQARRLELIYRRQSVRFLSSTGYNEYRDFFTFGDKPSPATVIQSGEIYRKTLYAIGLSGENQLLAPYLFPARDRISFVCPEIFLKSIDVPEIPPEIPPQNLKWKDVHTQAEADAFSKENNDHFKLERDRIEKISEIRKNRLKDTTDFSNIAYSCACKSLSDNGFTESDVCPKSDRPLMSFTNP